MKFWNWGPTTIWHNMESGIFFQNHSTLPYNIGFGLLLEVRIFGGPAIYVKEGSSVQLECVVSQAVNTPKYIVWEHNGQGQENNIAQKTFIFLRITLVLG